MKNIKEEVIKKAFPEYFIKDTSKAREGKNKLYVNRNLKKYIKKHGINVYRTLIKAFSDES